MDTNKPYKKRTYGKKDFRKDGSKDSRNQESTDTRKARRAELRNYGKTELRKLIAAQRIYGFKNLQTNGTKDFWTYGVQKILY